MAEGFPPKKKKGFEGKTNLLVPAKKTLKPQE
jgi:hypothetical protein